LVLQVIIGQVAVHRCNATVSFLDDKIPSIPPTINDDSLHDYFQSVAGSLLGIDKVKGHHLLMGSEDFAFYQEAMPGYVFIVGMEDVSVEGLRSWHSPYFKVNEDVLPYGAALHVSLATRYLAKLNQEVPAIDGKYHDEL